MTVHRRTFDAKSHPAGSVERAQLNRDVRTSEYMPSHRYCSVGEHHSLGFRTKAEAEAFEASTGEDDPAAEALAEWRKLMEGCEFMLDGAWDALVAESNEVEPDNGVVGIRSGQVWADGACIVAEPSDKLWKALASDYSFDQGFGPVQWPQTASV